MWDSHQATLTREVEQVQRRAARFVYNNYRDTPTGCVTRHLHQLEWDFLQHRRTIQRLVLCYKIRNKLLDIDPEKYYTPGDIRTRGSHRLGQQRANKEVLPTIDERLESSTRASYSSTYHRGAIQCPLDSSANSVDDSAIY